MNPIKIAVVPEHFSAPWKYAVANHLFENNNINVELIEYGTGTGAMCRDLSTGIIDMAVVLTEGILQHQQTDPSIKIISQFVETPLNWGIHVHADSSFKTVADLEHARFGISRFGSGSHLMVKELAKKQRWDFNKINFIESGPITALAKSISEKTTDVFLWEVLMTKSYYQDHHLRLLDTILSPWPCFQIAAAKHIADQTKLLTIIFSVCKQFNADHLLAAAVIEEFYHLPVNEVFPWLKTVKWSETELRLDLTIFNRVNNALKF